MKYTFLLLALIGSALLGCGDREATVLERPGEPDVVGVEATDPEMVAAIEKARSTIGEFIAKLKDKKPDQSFHVKRKFATTDGGVEHIWIDDVEFRNGLFHGKVGNTPVDVADVKLGDPATAKPAEITDWLIYGPGDEMQGAFSLPLLNRRTEGR